MLGIVSRLRRSSAPGPDEVPVAIVKEFCILFISPLTYLVNISFERGEYPTILKRSAVVPIFKKGSKSDIANYRPISLSSVFSKIFERAMYERLDNFLKKFQIISPRQHGFMKGKSVITALYDFLKYVVGELERRHCPMAIYCDLSKAFDCVNRNRLLMKMEKYGIRGVALKWFQAYLENRSQFVKIRFTNADNSTTYYCSKSLPINLGVPQGSILSPILFNLYINDLDLFIKHAEVIMYADDTSLLLSSESLRSTEALVNESLGDLYHWFCSNQLSLNIQKTHYMIFHTRQRTISELPSLSIVNNDLENTDIVKFLGVSMEDTLRWNDHCNIIAKKLHSKCYLMRSLRTYFSKSTLLAVYHSEIHSRITYGIIFWGHSSAAKQVFIAQKRVIRAIVAIGSIESCKPHFRNLKILPLPCAYILECVCFIHRNRSTYHTVSSIHSHLTRQRDNIVQTPFTLDISRCDVDNHGTGFYNHIPINIRRLSYHKFRTTVRNHLLSNCFYDTFSFLNNAFQ